MVIDFFILVRRGSKGELKLWRAVSCFAPGHLRYRNDGRVFQVHVDLAQCIRGNRVAHIVPLTTNPYILLTVSYGAVPLSCTQ